MRGLGLRPHLRVALAVIAAALRMADDHRPAAGIGDEELVLSADQSAEAAAKVSLSESEKLDHLKALVGGS